MKRINPKYESPVSCAVKVSFWGFSTHHKLPRLIELSIGCPTRTTALKLIV
jgi:hypothetical protein